VWKVEFIRRMSPQTAFNWQLKHFILRLIILYYLCKLCTGIVTEPWSSSEMGILEILTHDMNLIHKTLTSSNDPESIVCTCCHAEKDSVLCLKTNIIYYTYTLHYMHYGLTWQHEPVLVQISEKYFIILLNSKC